MAILTPFLSLHGGLNKSHNNFPFLLLSFCHRTLWNVFLPQDGHIFLLANGFLMFAKVNVNVLTRRKCEVGLNTTLDEDRREDRSQFEIK